MYHVCLGTKNLNQFGEYDTNERTSVRFPMNLSDLGNLYCIRYQIQHLKLPERPERELRASPRQ
jgi:hypothetical protein